jgi:hypothetical protein
MTQIDIDPAGEESDQHVVCVTPRASHTITVCEVPTKSKLVPYSRDEVLAPSDTQPGRHPGASFSLQQTTSKQECGLAK